MAHWEQTPPRAQSQGFRDSFDSGLRPEIIELAIPALAKTLEMTLDSIQAASFESINGDPEALETIESALMQHGTEELRPAGQFAKLITALLWLNRAEEACECACYLFSPYLVVWRYPMICGLRRAR